MEEMPMNQEKFITKEENQEENEGKLKILQPKNDVVFQALFTRGKERITKALLEDILKIKIHKLDLDKSKDLLNDNKKDKNGRLDLRAILNDNIECDIEIQLSTHDKVLERFLYYWSKMYSANLEIGEEYSKLRQTISIIIVDDEIKQFKEIKKACTKWQIREEEYRDKILTSYFQMNIIEISKAIKEYEKDKSNAVLQWMKFLDNPEDMEVRRIMEENQDIKEAKEELDKISQDDILRRMALKAKLERMDHKQELYEAKRDGRAEGEKIGRQQGETIGEARGRKEGIKQNQEETALKMLQKQMDIPTIKEITGLTEEEIKKLKEK